MIALIQPSKEAAYINSNTNLRTKFAFPSDKN